MTSGSRCGGSLGGSAGLGAAAASILGVGVFTCVRRYSAKRSAVTGAVPALIPATTIKMIRMPTMLATMSRNESEPNSISSE